MAYLVHPHGWRLYFSKYWKANFFSSKEAFLILFFKSKLLFDVILSNLNNYYFVSFRKNIFKFSSFKLLLNFSFLYVLIKYKLYWKNIYYEFSYMEFKKLFYLKKFYFNFEQEKKNFFGRALDKNKISFSEWSDDDNFYTLVFNNPTTKYLKTLFKKFIFFFFFIPQFIFLKDFLINSLNKINSLSIKKIYFMGLNQRNFNVKDLLSLIELLLRHKTRTNFILHKVIKILRFVLRRQKLKGFKILLAGRFTRRDRAIFLWKTKKAVSLGSRLSTIEYYTRSVFLQYSKCIIKIWLCRA